MQWGIYQTEAMKTKGKQDYEDSLIAGTLGLAGEAGEVADLIKKRFFHGHQLYYEELAKELGDVLWYVALLLDTTGLKMDDVLEMNLAKLRERYPDGFDPERSRNRDGR